MWGKWPPVTRRLAACLPSMCYTCLYASKVHSLCVVHLPVMWVLKCMIFIQLHHACEVRTIVSEVIARRCCNQDIMCQRTVSQSEVKFNKCVETIRKAPLAEAQTALENKNTFCGMQVSVLLPKFCEKLLPHIKFDWNLTVGCLVVAKKWF